MRKLKLLFTGFAFLGGVFSANAQTDVTSTYLTNADFSETTPITGTYLYGYGKDGSPYGYQAVDGWTSVVTSGDNSNASYPNSGTAAAVFSYGSSTQLKGNSKAAPATNPDGEASGNCFGFFGVWGCGGYYYQNVTLAAGKYTITVPMYSQSGTQANTTYTGFFPTSGTNRTVAVNPTVGEWVNQSVTFTLTDDTEGQIRIGYQSTGNGSGANPMLFIDCVKIEFTAIVVKDVLETAITAATKINTALEGALNDAIATAQAVYNDENATQEEVNAAAETLNNAVNQAMATASNINVTDLFLTNADLTSTEGWTAYASGTSGTNYQDYSNGLIGDYTVRFSPATVDDTHLATEYCFGFECRWSSNYASYNQTTGPVPAGVYTLTFDVENVNGSTTSANYNNLFYLEAGSNKVTDTATEWMQGGSNWTTHTIRITLEEATPLKVSFGYGTGSNNIGAANTPALYVSHIELNYSGFLAGAKAAWDDAKADAEAAIANEAYENVTGSERTALEAEIDKAEPTTVDGYNEAAAALNAATATFTAAKAAYDGLASLWSAGVPELIYATTEKYTAIGDAYFGEGEVVDATDAAARTAAMRTAIRAYYESHALAEKVEGAVNCADAIAGADPDVNTGWINGIGVDERTQEKYTDASGNPCGKYYDGGWSDKAGVNINMSRSIEIPAGRYLLTVTARGSENLTSYTLSIGEDDVDLPKNGGGVDKGVFGHGWDDVSLEFESDGHPVTLTIAATSTDYYQWISFNRFRLMRLELNTDAYAGATEYAALNAAIETAEAKTLGFEDGQYAPYNNVEALEALAAAKAIDQTAELTNLKADVEAVTTALNDATWTANDGDVAIVYNGTFAETGVGSNPKGWTRSNNGWGQQITGLTAEANGVDDGTTTAWYYNNNGAWEYGKDNIYKMPLAADTKYVLSFKYRKHGSDSQSWMKASVVNDSEEGLDVVQYPGAESNTIFQSAKAYFTTGAAGNYILRIEQNGNAHLTDVSIEKASSTTMDISENSTTIPELAFYETVSLTRTIKANDTWNTFVVPFDIDNDELKAKFGDDVAVAEYSEEADGEKSTVSFNTMATPAITANKPVLLKTSTAGTSYEFTGKLIKTGEAKVEGINFDFVGTYDATFTIPELDYFISDNKLWRAEENKTTIKGTRAYIHDMNPGNARIVNFFIDGQETTGISTIATQKFDNAAYDMQGRRVETLKKGVYVVNGKKVVVK